MHRAVLAAIFCLMTAPLAFADFDAAPAPPDAPAAEDPLPIGALLPASTPLLPLPAQLTDGYGALPGYRYAEIDGRPVLVEARSRRVLAALP